MSYVVRNTCVYVSCAESRELFVFALDAREGKLEKVQRLSVDGKIMPMALSRDGRFLYAALRDEPFRVASFALDAEGRLTRLADAPLPNSMAYLACDATGSYLLAASYPGHCVSLSPIRDGQPQAPTQVLSTPPNAHAILVDAANRYVLATSLGSHRFLRYVLDAEHGLLQDCQEMQLPDGTSPRHFVFSRDNRRVFLIGEWDAFAHCLDYDSHTGALRLAHSAAALDEPPGPGGAADIQLTPDERFLYTSERLSDTITGFAVDAESGALTRIGITKTVAQPRSFDIDSSGRWLVVAGQGSDNLAVLHIDAQTGALTPHGEYAVGRFPTWTMMRKMPRA